MLASLLSKQTVHSSFALFSRSFASQPSIGFIGLGKMGRNMLKNLAENDHTNMHVFDVEAGAMSSLEQECAPGTVIPCSSVSEVSSKSSVVFSMVPNDKVLRTVVEEMLGAGGASDKQLHISCSTVSPKTSRECSALFEQASNSDLKRVWMTSPVFARPDGLERKEASFCLSSSSEDRADWEQARSLLNTSASNLFEFGQDPGAANVVKLAGNFMIASTILTWGESISFVEREGVDSKAVYDMLTSTIFDNIIHKGYGGRIVNRDYREGGFALPLGFKDVRLVKEVATEGMTVMPLLSLLENRYNSCYNQGYQELDWSSLSKLAFTENQLDTEFKGEDEGSA